MGNKNIKAGFSLVEIAVVIVIMGIMAAMIVISPNAAKQTAKKEAERVQAYIYNRMKKADNIKRNFYIEIFTDYLSINWYDNNIIDKPLEATGGCKFSNYNTKDPAYNANNKRFPDGGTITVKGADGETYYVIFAAANEGRVRVSDTPPD